MKKTKQTLATIISIIILTFFAGPAWAGVCTGDYYIYTSNDIAALSGCTEINGSLMILQSNDITSLSALSNLTSVSGSFMDKE